MARSRVNVGVACESLGRPSIGETPPPGAHADCAAAGATIPSGRAAGAPSPKEPSVLANPIAWPDGARCAVAFTWDVDAESLIHFYFPDTADLSSQP